jgi:predicted acyltransferase
MKEHALDLTAGRVLAIDVFRGITIFVMVWVNELAAIRDIPWWMKHLPADVDGMTFVDLVFPAFLFIVGMSIPFAMQARANKGETTLQLLQHVALRSFGLVVIGVMMVSTIGGFDETRMPLSMPVWTLWMYLAVLLVWSHYPRTLPSLLPKVGHWIGILSLGLLAWLFRGPEDSMISPQWWGILGLIGWAYLLAGGVYLLTRRCSHVRGQLTWLALAAFVFLGIFAVMDAQKTQPVWQLLVSQINHHTHIALVLAGVILSILCYHPALSAHRTRNLTAYIAVLAVLAFASWQVWPISKIWATPSWALWSMFSCVVLFAMLYWLVDVLQWQRWCQLFAPAATNPLLAYILPYMLGAAAAIAGLNIRPTAFDQGMAGILWSLVFSCAIMLLTAGLTRLGLKVKL